MPMEDEKLRLQEITKRVVGWVERVNLILERR